VTEISFTVGSDDTGTGTDGEIVDAAYITGLKDAVDDLIHSTTNPTRSPAQTTDEVVAARGGEASLDARLDAIEADIGTPINSTTLAQSLGGKNLLANDDFLVWHGSDTAAPAQWALAAGSIQRCGTGLADTTSKFGLFTARVTVVAPATALSQTMVDASDEPDGAVVAVGAFGTIGYGAWVKTSSPATARIGLTDGVSTSFSSYHPGDGTFVWLSGTLTVAAAATELTFNLDFADADTAYVTAATVVVSPVAPTQWIPAETRLVSVPIAYKSGAVSAALIPQYGYVGGTGLVTEVVAIADTAPTGQALIFNVEKGNSAGTATLFSAGVSIADGQKYGQGTPDGTYANRCFAANTTISGLMVATVTQVGSGVAGSDLSIFALVKKYHPPLAHFRAGSVLE
jgi:hypothetical protein